MSEGPPRLELREVAKSFGGVRALRGVSFDLRAGEVHALVGENGAGKSTLVRILTGAVRADSGTIEIDGRPVGPTDPVLMRRLGVAPIYQQPALLPDLTVAENLALGLERAGLWRRVRWRERRRRAADLLARVGAAIEVDAPAHTLRMAEQQLVEIARALGADARVLLMDEPTASLTDREAARLFDLVRDLRGRGVGIVYISHRLEEIAVLADRVTVLRDGERVATRTMAGTSRAELIRLMVGRDVDAVYPRRAVPLGEVRLELKGVGCREAGVRGVDLTVAGTEIVGLAGLVGSGRTELARVLFGLTPADEGVVRVDGKEVRITSPVEAVRLGLAYLPEDRRRHGVIPEMSVAANTTLAALRAISRGGFLQFEKERDLARTYLRRFAIKAPSIETPVTTLSGGNQQKVALARWLATHPTVLVLDEPTQGVDVGAKAEIHWLIADLAAEGLAILLISSELPEVLGLSHRVAVMRAGTIVGTLEGRAATAEAVMTLALGHVPETPALDDGLSEGGRPSASWSTHRRELSVAAAYLLLLAGLAAAAPGFYAAANVRDILVGAAPLLVAAVAMTAVILARQIDISIGSQFAVCAVVAGLVAKAGVPVAGAGAIAVAVGAALGAFNGFLVAVCGLPAIVVTLATMVALREGLRWATQGSWVEGLPAGFQWMGLGQDTGRVAIPLLAVAVWAVSAWALRHLAAGRAVYAAGSDAEVARLAGLRPRHVVFGTFVAMGALTGLAALLSAIQFIDVQTNSGVGFELRVIAAVVVGGTSIAGGRGSLLGTLLGVLLLATAGPALTYLGSEAYWDRALQGVIILLAVAADALGPRRRGGA